LSETILESELFGHVKGAYTGAASDRIGRFEAAHQGTLFLDEIGDIPLSVQVKLLRVLEEQMIQRVGDNRSIPIDVRIITATNRDLETMIRRGQFREDLFFRINVFPVVCPPLRERKDDITLIIQHFITILAEKTGKNILGFTPQAMRLMVSYPWSGNIRELRNAVEYAFVLAKGKSIGVEHLPEKLLIDDSDIFDDARLPETQPVQTRLSGVIPIKQSEQADLVDALNRADGNQTRAAEILGVSRVTVWKRMKKHGIILKNQGK
jgi:transcriptional regulator with GAF, ATPase, and Fis domain